MRLTEINKKARTELEEIINDLFITVIDSKLNENTNTLTKEIGEKSRGITSKIRDVSTIIDKNKEEIEDSIHKIKSEGEAQKGELLKITNNGVESIQKKLSEIQNESLAEILSNSTNFIENQKMYSEDFLLKLDVAINSHTRNILLNNSENQELVKKSQAEFKTDIVTLINVNGCNQKKNIQDLCKNISDCVELENQNNSNLQKQLETEFQKMERMNSTLIRNLEEKLEFFKLENEKQVSAVIRRSNSGFISVLVINVLIFLFLLLIFFSS